MKTTGSPSGRSSGTFPPAATERKHGAGRCTPPFGYALMLGCALLFRCVLLFGCTLLFGRVLLFGCACCSGASCCSGAPAVRVRPLFGCVLLLGCACRSGASAVRVRLPFGCACRSGAPAVRVRPVDWVRLLQPRPPFRRNRPQACRSPDRAARFFCGAGGIVQTVCLLTFITEWPYNIKNNKEQS